MTTPPDDDHGHHHTPRSRMLFAGIVLVTAILAFVVGGAFGRHDRDAALDERRERFLETERLSDSLDASREGMAQLQERAKRLEPSVTGDSGFMATADSVRDAAIGDAVTDGGNTGVVTGVRVVDEVKSYNEERLPGAAPKGRRWVVVGGTYTTTKSNSDSSACAADDFVTLVATNGTTYGGQDDYPVSYTLPRFPGPKPPSCLDSKPVRGIEQPFRSAIAVPEDAKIRGVLVGDMRARSGVIGDPPPAKDRLGWIEFDEPMQVGAKGDDVAAVGEEPTLS